MGAIAPDTIWSTPDDLLLRKAVEDGASLESLSKGAVRFSQRYTIQELQDRWHSLIYDPIVSVETSALMFEHERSSLRAQAKSGKSDGTKDSKSHLGKRKAESIRKCYYAMREMVSSVSQGVDTLDMNFLAGHGITNYKNHSETSFSDFILSDPCHHRFPDSTFEGTHASPDTLSGNFPATANDITSAPSIFVSGALSVDPCDLGHNTSLSLVENVLSTRDHCMTENHGQLNELPFLDLHKSEGLEVKQPTILNQVTNSEVPIADCGTPLHNLIYEYPFSPATDWHTMEGISSPILPEDYINDAFESSHDVDNLDTLESSEMHENTNLNEQMPYLDPETDDAGIIAQWKQFFDCTDLDDLPDPVDELYIDTFSNLLVDYPNEHEGEIACPSLTLVATEGYPNLSSGEIDGESRDRNSNNCRINQFIVYSPEGKEKLLSSALSVNPAFPELRNGVICCRLNTEDHVVPDNDDVFLPVCMPTLSLSCLEDWELNKSRNPVSSSIMDIPTHQRANRGGPLTMKNKQNDSENLLLSSFPTHLKIMRKKELLDNKHIHSPSLTFTSSLHNYGKTIHGGGHKMEREQIDSNRAQIISSSLPAPQNITNQPMSMVKGEEDDNNETHIMSSSLQQIVSSRNAANVHDGNSKLKYIDPRSDRLRIENENNHIKQLSAEDVAPGLEKDHELFGDEECPDDDVPYFSDVEAMILDMDFSPNYEDNDPSDSVLRHPNEKLIKKVIRLEAVVRTSSRRMMQAYGAFAVLYSNHTRHLIKKPKVLLGRAAEDDQVDIDLSTERCRNRVSRRQAIIKVNDDGAFTLKNLGKASLYVNGRELSTRESQYLTSSCLIEILNAAFLFETNPARVKRYIEEEIRRGSKMPNIEEEIHIKIKL